MQRAGVCPARMGRKLAEGMLRLRTWAQRFLQPGSARWSAGTPARRRDLGHRGVSPLRSAGGCQEAAGLVRAPVVAYSQAQRIPEPNWPFWGRRGNLPVLNCLILSSVSIPLVCRWRKPLSFCSPLLGALNIITTRAACPFPTVHILAFSFYQISSMFLVILLPFLWLFVTFAILFSEIRWQVPFTGPHHWFFLRTLFYFLARLPVEMTSVQCSRYLWTE